MTTPSAPHARKLAWIALWLLVISVCINYADRGNLGVAAKSLEAQLKLNPDQLGTLLAAFSLTYAFALLAAGKLIDRFNVNWLYALAFLLWSAATGATGFASGFASILVLRLVLGISESIAYPAYSKMIVTSFPENLRGTANGLIDAGSKLGPAVGVYLGVKMLGWFGWRGMFMVMGGASLLWLVPWSAIAGKLPASVHEDRNAPPPAAYPLLATKRAFWGTAIGLFGGNYAWYFLLNWLPYYFETVRHYTHDRLALFASMPFWAIAASSTCFGLLADFFIHRGYPAGRVRQLFLCFGLMGCCALLYAAISAPSASTSNVLLILAFISLGAWSSNHWAFSQFLAGPTNAGSWTGLQNFFGNLAGVLGPWLAGRTLQLTHSFFAAFSIGSGFCIVAAASYWFLVGRPAQVFPNPAPAPSRTAEAQW